MKKIFLIAALCFAGHVSMAQINTNLVIVQQPPGSLISWGTKDLAYIITGQVGAPPRKAVIKAVLTTASGDAVATTNLAKAKVYNVGQGTLILNAMDVIPLDVMVFNGKYKTSLDKTGKLPADNYQLCVQLVTPIDFIPISEQRCRNFTLAAFQLPIPVMPANEMVLDIEKAQSTITFRWTPVAPRPAEQVTYRVTVFEILPYQTPMQALRSNMPLLAKDVIGTTQYIWQPQLGLTKCCKDSAAQKNINTSEAGVGTGKDKMMIDGDMDAYAYIWTLQTLDNRGVPFGDGNVNGDGISEPLVFFIDRRPAAMRHSGPPSRVIYLNNGKH
jgi:hypothetical protein